MNLDILPMSQSISFNARNSDFIALVISCFVLFMMLLNDCLSSGVMNIGIRHFCWDTVLVLTQHFIKSIKFDLHLDEKLTKSSSKGFPEIPHGCLSREGVVKNSDSLNSILQLWISTSRLKCGKWYRFARHGHQILCRCSDESFIKKEK